MRRFITLSQAISGEDIMWIRVDEIDFYVIECPFCGKANAEIINTAVKDMEIAINKVHCLKCHSIGPAGFTKGEAVKLWNRRRG
jgi:Lar family restriction alleviation protein